MRSRRTVQLSKTRCFACSLVAPIDRRIRRLYVGVLKLYAARTDDQSSCLSALAAPAAGRKAVVAG